MLTLFLDNVTTLAALFCRRWSRFSSDLFSLYNAELPISSLEVMYAWDNSSATWSLICLRTIPIFLSDMKAARDTAEMWRSMERLESKMIPRFLTVSDGGMTPVPTLIPEIFTFDLWCWDPITMNSVFPSFSFRKFEVIQWRSSSRGTKAETRVYRGRGLGGLRVVRAWFYYDFPNCLSKPGWIQQGVKTSLISISDELFILT